MIDAKNNVRYKFSNLLYAPQITQNLISVSKFASDNQVFFEFGPPHCFIRDQDTRDLLLKETIKGGIYAFENLTVSPNITDSRISPSSFTCTLQDNSSIVSQ
ncbi:hypothetical protein OC725_02960, partial ['Bituminaria bituminosa' little leaf phytoplasma]